jgi:hypothetical protein
MLRDYIGKEVESDYNLNQKNDDKVQLVTRGTKYLVIDVLGVDFVIRNDAGRFDIISCTYFKTGD